MRNSKEDVPYPSSMSNGQDRYERAVVQRSHAQKLASMHAIQVASWQEEKTNQRYMDRTLNLILLIVWAFVAMLSLSLLVPPVVADEWDLQVNLGAANTGALHAVVQEGNHLWIGAENGLFQAELDGSGVNRSAVTDKAVYVIRRDSRGNLWFGGGGGLFQRDPNSPVPFNAGYKSPVRAIQIVKNDLWIGTDAGLYRRPLEGKTTTLTPVTADLGPVSHLDAGNGVIWVGTELGLFTWDPAKNKLGATSWRERVQRVHRGKDYLWISDASGREARTARYKLLSDSRIAQKPQATATTGLVFQFLEVTGILWIASDRGLLRWRLDQTTPDPIIILANRRVDGISLNGQTLWIATSRGLCKIMGMDGSDWGATVTITSGPSASFVNFLDKVPTIAWTVEHPDWRTTRDLIVGRIFLYDIKSPNQPFHTWPILPGQFQRKLDLPLGSDGNVLPPKDYRLIIEVEDFHGKMAHSAPYTFSVRDQSWMVSRLLLIVLIAGAIFVALFQLLPTPARRIVQAYLFRYRWRLETKSCDFVFDVLPARGEFRIGRLTNTTDALSDYVNPSTSWPPGTPELDGYRPRMRGKRIQVEVDLAAFRYPWSHLIGDRWSRGKDAAIAGQLIRNLKVEPPPLPRRRLRFAGLGCDRAPGFLVLFNLEPELRAVTAAFNRSRAKSIIDEKSPARHSATIADLSRALQEADIVHLGAHAEPEQIHLARGSIFTAANVEAIPSIRCRLLVLSACKAADFQHAAGSYAVALVRRGVNLLASLGPLGDEFCMAFFPSLYDQLMPAGRPSGVDLCASIQGAAESWLRINDRPLPTPLTSASTWIDHLDWVDRLIIFGNPTLQFHFG